MKQLVFYLISSVITLLVLVTCSELMLRGIGHGPWTYATLDRNEPTMNEPHPELGWRSKKGTYQVPPYVKSGQPTSVTVLDRGRRATGVVDHGRQREIVFVGDSFTHGRRLSSTGFSFTSNIET